MMQYSGSLFAVKDIKAATEFYQDLFGLEVLFDFGQCVSFAGGFALQQDFDWLTGIPANEMKNKENNCEIGFEGEDFGDFVKRLKARHDVVILHDVSEHSWGQRVIRFYDLDDHLIEVGETMKSVVERFLSQGKTIEEIALKMDVNTDAINQMLTV